MSRCPLVSVNELVTRGNISPAHRLPSPLTYAPYQADLDYMTYSLRDDLLQPCNKGSESLV